jgi:hypothetical protein
MYNLRAANERRICLSGSKLGIECDHLCFLLVLGAGVVTSKDSSLSSKWSKSRSSAFAEAAQIIGHRTIFTTRNHSIFISTSPLLSPFHSLFIHTIGWVHKYVRIEMRWWNVSSVIWSWSDQLVRMPLELNSFKLWIGLWLQLDRWLEECWMFTFWAQAIVKVDLRF